VKSFGLATLLPDPPNYSSTAEAVLAGELLDWNHHEISQLSDRYPQIKTNGLRIAPCLLGTVSDRHANLFEGSASHRMARALIDVGRRSGGIHPKGIDVHFTNEQLGSLADVSRFTASRVLSGWSKAGVVTLRNATQFTFIRMKASSPSDPSVLPIRLSALSQRQFVSLTPMLVYSWLLITSLISVCQRIEQ
jgi:CRP-like cAMP-binding protein